MRAAGGFVAPAGRPGEPALPRAARSDAAPRGDEQAAECSVGGYGRTGVWINCWNCSLNDWVTNSLLFVLLVRGDAMDDGERVRPDARCRQERP